MVKSCKLTGLTNSFTETVAEEAIKYLCKLCTGHKGCGFPEESCNLEIKIGSLLLLGSSFLAKKFGLGKNFTPESENSKNSSPHKSAWISLIRAPVAREMRKTEI